MNADVHWENEAHSVLRCSFSGEWDWKVFYATIRDRIIFEEDHDPCLLVDVRGIARMPIDMVLHLKPAAQLASEIKGMIVIIATSVGATTMYHMMASLNRPFAAKIRLAASDEEAYALLGIAI